MYNTKKKTLAFIIAIVALSIAVITFLTLMIVYIARGNDYKKQLENTYQKVYYELVSSVNNLEVKMSKLLVSANLSRQQQLLTAIALQAEQAEYNLSELPLHKEETAHMTNYLNKLSDYSKYLSKNLSSGKKVQSKEFNNIKNMYNANKGIMTELEKLSQKINAKYGFSDNHRKKYSKSNPSGDTFKNFTQKTVEIPELIYDGPFSDGRENREVKGLNFEEVTSEHCVTLIKKYFEKEGVTQISFQGETTSKNMSLYNFDITLKNGGSFYVQLTKKGGKLISMNGYTNGNKDSAKIEKDEAIKIAEEFLKAMQFENMTSVWYVETDSIATINFASEQSGHVCYPDLVKIKVNLEKKSIQGVEAFNYFLNHTNRAIEQITQDETSEKIQSIKREIADNLDITSERKCIIPYESNQERQAVEITAESDGLQYFVYLDSKTGEELDIFRVVDTKQGQLLI